MRCVSVLLTAVIAGCAAQPQKPAPLPAAPKIVRVPVTRYVRIPDTLTEPCVAEAPRDKTIAELLRIARSRRACNEKDSADKAQIRAIQGTEPKQ